MGLGRSGVIQYHFFGISSSSNKIFFEVISYFTVQKQIQYQVHIKSFEHITVLAEDEFNEFVKMMREHHDKNYISTKKLIDKMVKSGDVISFFAYLEELDTLCDDAKDKDLKLSTRLAMLGLSTVIKDHFGFV